MNADKFKQWRVTMGYKKIEAAEKLSVGRNTIATYEKNGAPKYIGLACAALAMGLPEWGSSDNGDQ